VSAYATCQDAAFSNLTDQLRERGKSTEETELTQSPMSGLIVTASIVKTGKGRYVWPVPRYSRSRPSRPVSSAVRKLKEAVLVLQRDAAEAGVLMNTLEEAGYTTDLISFPGSNLRPSLAGFELTTEVRPIIFDSHDASVPMSVRLRTLTCEKQPTGEERKWLWRLPIFPSVAMCATGVFLRSVH
jgi:hypothetical protein